MAVSLVLLAAALPDLRSEEPAQVRRTPGSRARELLDRAWIEVIQEEVPPLRHERGERWPMIMWHGVGTQRLKEPQIQMLLSRGLTQHLPLSKQSIPAAQALQAAGSPVILMEGRTDHWPYSLAGEPARWAHQFDPGYDYRSAGENAWQGACPLMIEGWRKLADQVRDTMLAFRAAGVTVDGVWMDWEGDPYPWKSLFRQLRHCQRCRQQLPARVIHDQSAWFHYAWRMYLQLYGTYLAAPVREVFPQCAVTNWQVVYSQAARPAHYFVDDRTLPPGAPTMFTATNPIAYGNDQYWQSKWQSDFKRDRTHVDQFYMHLLLRQVSEDTANRQALGDKHVRSFPWVARWCPLLDAEDVPDLSRPAYREALRHLWLRGCDSMQVFNALRTGFEEQSLFELQDAVAVYDEMSVHRELLERAEVMQLSVPPQQNGTVFWSGLRTDREAVVRATSQDQQSHDISIRPWPDCVATILASPEGASYRLRRTAPDNVSIEPLPTSPASRRK